MSRILLFTLLTVVLLACGRGDREKDILPPDKMQAVMYDMMRADQFISDYMVNKDTSKKRETESRYYYSRVFQLHQISADRFRESLTWYREHPEKLRALMDSISQPAKQVLPDPVTESPIPATAPAVPVTDETPAPARKRRDSLPQRPVRQDN